MPIIRKAQDRDLDPIVRLHIEATELMHELSPEGFGETLKSGLNPEKEKGFFKEALGDANASLLVAEKDGKIAGFIMGVVETHGDDLITAPFVTVQYISIDKSLRGSGVGSALMRAIEDWARSKGITTLDLLVWASNQPARNLFTKSGFIALEMRMAKRLEDRT